MRGLLSVLVLVAVVSDVVAAPGGAARRRREAEEQLLAGETDAALAIVEAGLREAPRDKELLLLRGHVLLRRADYEDAAAAYRAYLAAGASGTKKKGVLRILESLEQVASTFVLVKVQNGPAEVRLDTRTGKPFCVADPECRKSVMPGDHLVVIDKPGHVRVARRVLVAAAATERIELTLVEKPSALVVKTVPADADVIVDGQLTPKEVSAGEHKIEVSAAGFVGHAQTFRARGGEPVELTVTLRRGVPFTVRPLEATITIDGAPAKVVDGVLALPEGAKQITVSAPGHYPATVGLPVERVAVSLRPLVASLVLEGGEEGALVVVDNEPRGTLPLPAPLELTPGEHAIEVRAADKRVVRGKAQISAGQQAVMYVEARQRPRYAAWTMGAVTVGGLAATGIFGFLALRNMNDYDERSGSPGVSRSDAELRKLEKDGDRYALYADISMGVTAVAMVTSMILFRFEGRRAAGHIDLRAAPGGVELSGSF